MTNPKYSIALQVAFRVLCFYSQSFKANELYKTLLSMKHFAFRKRLGKFPNTLCIIKSEKHNTAHRFIQHNNGVGTHCAVVVARHFGNHMKRITLISDFNPIVE